MNIVQKLKCSFSTNFEAYYQKLSTEQLLAKKRQLKRHTLVPSLAWAAAIIIMALANVGAEILIIFSGSAGGAIISLNEDRKKRLNAINKTLNNR